jgi:hypothetical protein
MGFHLSVLRICPLSESGPPLLGRGCREVFLKVRMFLERL